MAVMAKTNKMPDNVDDNSILNKNSLSKSIAYLFLSNGTPYLIEYGNKKRGLSVLFFWVEDGTRTHDPRNHNPVL